MLKVGEKAPEFELQAFHQNTFKQIKLADYAGKWLFSISIRLISPLYDQQS